MKVITVKYSGECRKCEKVIEAGETAIHERHIGLFCPTCEPTDPEEIRHYRQEAGNHRAEKYDEWAGKREVKAEAQLNSHPEIRHDWAFITQPGRIPFRDRMNKADSRACESLNIAENMRDKAESLRHVRVKGDAEKRWQARRDSTLTWLKVGMTADAGMYAPGVVLKINKKTATFQGKFGKYNVDLAFISPLKETAGSAVKAR